MHTWNHEPLPKRRIRSHFYRPASPARRTDLSRSNCPRCGSAHLTRESDDAALAGSESGRRPTFREWWAREGKAVAAFLTAMAMLIAMVVFAWGFVWVSPS